MKPGCVYLVGAGPGHPGLFTLRGREVLSKADVVVYDALISPRLLAYAPPHAERIYVGKRSSCHTLAQQEINQLLVDKARSGSMVVRLKGGDPFVFGRGGEEALALVDAGVPFEVVPGVTAGVAGAAYAGIPVTHRSMASSVGLITGHEALDKENSCLDWNALARWEGTLVFYMSMENLGAICERLINEGKAPDTPAAVVRWGTTCRQRTVKGTLSGLRELVEQTGLGPPALIIIGQAVCLRDKLQWFERRPLFGRGIIVTRARSQASELADRLEELGAWVIEMPCIRIEPPEDDSDLKDCVRRLAEFDWVIFSSVNGVEHFFNAMKTAGRDARALAGIRVCAVGPATADRLAGFGILADARPGTFTSAEIVETLASFGKMEGLAILCPRTDIGPRDLVEALAARGVRVREVTAYRTVAQQPDLGQISELLEGEGVQWLTFTSTSTVNNFFGAADAATVRSWSARIASIGPSTTAALARFGFSPDAEAADHTIDGLIDSIIKHENEETR